MADQGRPRRRAGHLGRQPRALGLRLENVIADAVAEERGWTLLPGGHRTSSRIEGWGCTLDREIGDRGGGVLELKTVDWLVRKRDWGEEPPPHILLQLQAQLGVTGREWGAVAALVGGNELRIWEYQARPRIIAEIAKRARLLEIDPREPSAAGRWQPQHRRHAGRAVSQRRAPDAGPARRQPGPEACAGYLRAREAEAAARREKAHYEAIPAREAGDAEAVMVNGFTVRLPAIAAIPDRVAEPGETIKGRAGYRRLSVSTRRPSSERIHRRRRARGQGAVDKAAPEFSRALPAHVPPERFRRIAETAILNNPDVLHANRRSLMSAVIKAAQDGLPPDGQRQAALVVFRTKAGPQVQYADGRRPAASRAQQRQLAGIVAEVVHENDTFDREPTNFEAPVTHRPRRWASRAANRWASMRWRSEGRHAGAGGAGPRAD